MDFAIGHLLSIWEKYKPYIASWLMIAGAWPIAPAFDHHSDLDTWVLWLDAAAHGVGVYILVRILQTFWRNVVKGSKITIIVRKQYKFREDDGRFYQEDFDVSDLLGYQMDPKEEDK